MTRSTALLAPVPSLVFAACGGGSKGSRDTEDDDEDQPSDPAFDLTVDVS